MFSWLKYLTMCRSLSEVEGSKIEINNLYISLSRLYETLFSIAILVEKVD